MPHGFACEVVPATYSYTFQVGAIIEIRSTFFGHRDRILPVTLTVGFYRAYSPRP